MTKLSSHFLAVARKCDIAYEIVWNPGMYYCDAACPKIKGRKAYEGWVTAFKPDRKKKGDRWFDGYRSMSEQEIIKRKDHRVFALLFMSELAKDQNL